MKKNIALGLILAGSLLSAGTAFADSTTTPMVGGHRTPFLAGFTDSINNKGAWLLSNYPESGKIVYVAEHPEIKAKWLEVLNAFLHIN